MSIKYSGPQAGGSVRSPPDSSAETSPGVVDRLVTILAGKHQDKPSVVIVLNHEVWCICILIREGKNHGEAMSFTF